MSLIVGAFAACAWLVVLLLPSRPWSTRERIDVPVPADRRPPADLADVTVVVPARNEAAHIATTLAGLAEQGRNLRAIIVDDQSTDTTAALAARAGDGADSLRVDVVTGQALPPGWGGKLWALEQGVARVDTEWTLLLDADIELKPGIIETLRNMAQADGRDMVSVMADLRCESRWERLLVPPFIYFFKLIYPFARVGDPASRTAAAAGGCILVRSAVLRRTGAFESLKAALIDDCTLAALVKGGGGRLWLGLSHAVVSRRPYDSLAVFTHMITRTAFTQLRYSTALLLLVTVLMAAVFGGPFAVIWNHPDAVGVSVGMTALLAMFAAFLPVLRWYSLPAVRVVTLPVAAALYLGMTWLSAIAYWRGVRAQWKGRAYAAD